LWVGIRPEQCGTEDEDMMAPDERKFHDLVTLSGPPVPGDVLTAEVGSAKGSFLSLLDAGGSALLHVDIDDPGPRLRVACEQANGSWDVRGWLPVAVGANAVRIEFLEAAIDVSVAPSARLRIAVDPRSVFRVAATEGWRAVRLELVGAADAARRVLTDIAVLPETGGGARPDLIFDIGMHNGDDTAFYLAKGFRVVAIDANPVLCTAAARRFARPIEEGRLHILNIGIGPRPGRMEFHINRTHSEWSSFDAATASRGHDTEAIMVHVQDIAGLIARMGVPYYAKVDIEGFDAEAVIPLVSASQQPCFISYENGTLDIFETLVATGYTRFKLVNQAEVPSQVPPIPPREGLPVQHRFNPGSSGLFGEESPGAWLPAAPTRALLRSYQEARSQDLARTLYIDWFDLHAARDAAEVAARRPRLD